MLGHLDVGDEDVGSETGDCVERLATVGGAGDDGDVGFEFEECGEGAEDHGLVFGEDDANGWLDAAHRATQGAFELARGCLRELDEEGDAGVGGDGEAATERLDALAHAAETVAFLELWMGAIVGDEEGVVAVRRRW